MSSNVLPDRGPIDEIWAKGTENDAGVWVSDEPTIEGVGERYLRATEARLHADELAAATAAFVDWLESEDTSPDYGGLTRNTHPRGEEIWREWWDSNLEKCDRAKRLGKAALAAAEGGQ